LVKENNENENIQYEKGGFVSNFNDDKNSSKQS
jgi:hypothetical protein